MSMTHLNWGTCPACFPRFTPCVIVFAMFKLYGAVRCVPPYRLRTESQRQLQKMVAYLLNVEMFDELYKIASAHDMGMTVYVDDAAFSSNIRISRMVPLFISRWVGRVNEPEPLIEIYQYLHKLPLLKKRWKFPSAHRRIRN